MKRIFWLYVMLLLVGVFFVIASFGYLFPSDVLRNIPSFSEDGWQRPKNALQADPVFQFEPWRDFAKSELLAGRIPLWNNLNGNGAPLLANSINAALFPLNFLYYIFPASVSITLIHCLKLIFFFFFFYLYLRSLKVSTAISLLGAFVGTFSGYMILWLYWPQTNVYLLLPCILYVTERIYQTRQRRYRWFALTAIIYFLMILGNHPETLFHIGMLHVAYILFRLWNDFRTIIAIFCSIFVGFLLGAMQILPLIEYLKYSYVLEHRSLVPQNFFLPFISILLMGIPFMFGAPNLPYYRHITQATNFQEVLGGYAGIIVLLTAAVGVFQYSKDILIRFWSIVILVSFAMAYNIWPIKYINALPLMSTSANHRLIAFVNFGLLVIFCLVLQKILTKNSLDKARVVIADKVFVLLSLLIAVGTVVAGIFLPQHLPKYAYFIPFFLWHALFILFSTIFFFWSLIWYIRKQITTHIWLSISFVLVAAQTFGLFWNYNPLVDAKYFYPKTEVIKMLEKQPKGNIIELGNPTLPPNVNMKYQIPHVINNDAVEIRWYRQAIKDTFPNKNHWGNPDTATAGQLQKLNVSYVLSDFDITLKKNRVQPDESEILHPITKVSPYIINFKPDFDNFSELRVKTANYNRHNTCHISFTLFVKSIHREVIQRSVPCTDIRNNMFYTISVPSVGLEKNSEYQLEIRSDTDDEKNAVAFYGSHNRPFLELLSEPETKTKEFTQIGKTKTTYIWKVNGVERVEGVRDYSILYEDPQRLVLDVTTTKPTDILIKNTYYPGWKATVNGKVADLQNANPFMKLHVNSGKSYVEIMYKPTSFFAGIMITMFSGVLLFLYILRNERDTFLKLYKKQGISREIKRHVFWEHCLIIGSGLFISIILFTIAAYVFPLHVVNPWTTAINWFTKHNYPRYQDYFYFYFGFLFVFLFTFGVWGFWLWKKRK